MAISYAKKYGWKIVEYQQNDDKTSFKTRNLIMPKFGSLFSGQPSKSRGQRRGQVGMDLAWQSGGRGFESWTAYTIW